MGDISNKNFDTLRQKTIITNTIVTRSQLHIGSGERDEKNVQKFITIEVEGRRIPYIPGSSLKGVFRSLIAQIYSDEDVESYLFGSKSVDLSNACAAHIKIFDAFPLGWENELMNLYSKPGVAIDRRTGAASPGMLFWVEVIPPGVEFEFKMIIENIDLIPDTKDESNETNKKLVNAIKYILKELNEGNITIGAKATSGLGRIQFKEPKNFLEIQYITSQMILEGQDYQKIKFKI